MTEELYCEILVMDCEMKISRVGNMDGLVSVFFALVGQSIKKDNDFVLPNELIAG